MREQTKKKRKTKIDFRFIVFRFMREQTKKRKKRKLTSVLLFFVL